MSGVELVEVVRDDDGIRIDRWFKRHYPAVSHGRLEKMLRKGEIRLDGGRVKASDRIARGQVIRVPPIPAGEAAPTKQAPAPLSRIARSQVEDMILYEDDEVIVLSKPQGLAVQGGTKTTRHVDGLLKGYAASKSWTPHLVHRIDKETSGILLMAKSPGVAAHLTKAFRDRACRKCYWALVEGVPKVPEGVIDMAVQKKAGGEDPDESHPTRKARTIYRVVDRAAQKVAWVEMEPVTGRTHQLRIHCAAIGHPILGDHKYGEPGIRVDAKLARVLHLHARALSFPHPSKGQMTVEAPLPPQLKADWSFFGFETERPAEFFDD